MVIAPYRYHGSWVFDDEAAGLEREPFVSGIPQMIDIVVKDIPNAESGFRLIFSASPFPGFQIELTWEREEFGGNWYCWKEKDMTGWLCPAMFAYFDCAPDKLFLKAEAARREA